MNPNSLEYITKKLRRYFKQQKRKRKSKDLPYEVVKMIESLVFPPL